ncbi:MAG: DNA polymerase I [Spirochaetes bacterium]|nr:DNA polymerase I [Spirochaetota bacterium]
MKTPLYLLDSYAVIYRSYFAFISKPLTNPKGENRSAVFGFFRSLFALFDQYNPGAFAAVFDSRGPTFRHLMFEAYKANRQKTPEDLHAQIPVVEEALRLLGLPILRVDGFEADDIIATLAERCRLEDRPCYVISGDKDLLQLVGGSVRAMKPEKDTSWRILGPGEVAAEWGVEPERILDYLSLTGDASDNVPGVPGVGDKTAQKLLAEFRGIDDIYARLGEVKPDGVRKKLEAGRDSAYLSRELITLRLDVPLDIEGPEGLAVRGMDRAAANPVFRRENMKSLVSKNPGDLFAGTAGPVPTDATTPASSSDAGRAGGQTPGPALPRPTAKPTPPELLVPGSYDAILDLEALDAAIAECERTSVFAFDLETDSLDELAVKPVGFSLAWKPGIAVYVPLVSPDAACVPEEEARARLAKIAGNPLLTMVGHNLKFDRHVLENWLCPASARPWDTMVAAWLLDPEQSSFSLGSLAEARLGSGGLSYGKVVPKGSVFSSVSIAAATAYAAEDADFTLRLRILFAAELEEAGLAELFRDVEMPILPILGEMERAGIGLDAGTLRSYGVELDGELERIKADIYVDVGHEFNIASTKQLQEVLFVERRLASGKKTKTGFSTDVSVLEELAREDPVPAKILRHRSLAKLKSTYVDALLALDSPDGRVHTHFMQTGTATGRLSSRDPNLQNIPVREEEGRRIRESFVSAPGQVFISADYAQIELVVFAHLSRDPELCKAFEEGSDVHRRTAALIFGITEADVTPERRRMAKTINFGVIYGMSAFRLSNELGIGRGEAQKFIDAYFGRYVGVKTFMADTIRQAERTGYVTTILGRRRPVPRITSGNKTEKQAAERVAVNTPIQGSAADIVKLAMIRVRRTLAERHPEARLLLQVHDELIVETPKAGAEAVAETVRLEMESTMRLSVPLRASVEIAERWGDMH